MLKQVLGGADPTVKRVFVSVVSLSKLSKGVSGALRSRQDTSAAPLNAELRPFPKQDKQGVNGTVTS